MCLIAKAEICRSVTDSELNPEPESSLMITIWWLGQRLSVAVVTVDPFLHSYSHEEATEPLILFFNIDYVFKC